MGRSLGWEPVVARPQKWSVMPTCLKHHLLLGLVPTMARLGLRLGDFSLGASSQKLTGLL
jgi:hypothetical protein